MRQLEKFEHLRIKIITNLGEIMILWSVFQNEYLQKWYHFIQKYFSLYYFQIIWGKRGSWQRYREKKMNSVDNYLSKSAWREIFILFPLLIYVNVLEKQKIKAQGVL